MTILILLFISTLAFSQVAVNDSIVDSLQSDARDEVIMTASELASTLIDDDNAAAGQNISGLLRSRGDIYATQTSFSFSPMRFKVRGYNGDYESTYINGVNFNGAERGYFNYSMIGGLNDAVRDRHSSYGIEANTFSYGNIGYTNHINMRASAMRGGRATLSLTNRGYQARVQASYGTGIMPSGWAFSTAIVARLGSEELLQGMNIVEGSSYTSAGAFFAVEKIMKRHSINLSMLAAPTQRGQQSAVTGEVTELTSIYYNPYWGYQDGKKRNSRIVKSLDPTAILSHEWKINENHLLRTGVGFHYSMYSNSALNFYNAPDPRPDYYRYMPSYLLDGQISGNDVITGQVNTNLYNELTQKWQSGDATVTQLNWDNFYQSNYRNNVSYPNSSAKYMLERRHNNLMETSFNSTYNGNVSRKLKITAGLEFKYSKGMHYKTVDDLLGANQWIDIDQFAERDLTGGTLQDSNPVIVNNNIQLDSDGKIDVEKTTQAQYITNTKQRFGYDYDINIYNASAFIQNQWDFNFVHVYYAAKLSSSTFYREGHMLNGRAAKFDESNALISNNSTGKSKILNFIDPSFKAGAQFRPNARNIFTINALVETRAPLAYNSFVSPRVKDNIVSGLTNEKVLSYDIAYNFSYPRIRGRVAAFQTHSKDAVELNGYYNDEYRTFTMVTMSGVDKIYRGVELGVSFKLSEMFSLVAAGTYADYSYTSDAVGTLSPENGAFDDIQENVLIKGLKVNSGPQLAGSLSLKFFHNMWFADITINGFGNNYLDFAPSRFFESQYYGGQKMLNGKLTTVYGYMPRPDQDPATIDYSKYVVVRDANGNVLEWTAKETLGTQEKLPSGFFLDASVGKMIYFKNGKSLSINLSVNNILNNTTMITGGYQQGRIPTSQFRGGDVTVSNNVNKFPNKYYYAQGLNFFLNVGFRF